MSKDQMIDKVMDRIGTTDPGIRLALEALYALGRVHGSDEMIEAMFARKS